MDRPRIRVPGGRRLVSSAYLASAYQTAGDGPRSRAFRPGGFGPNAAIDGAVAILRRQARDLCRKNHMAATIPQKLAQHVVGTGIVPDIGDDEAAQVWLRWTDQADADGACDLYGQQALIMAAVVEAGEVFVRLRLRRPDDGLLVPLQAQVLEADYVPLDKNEDLGGGRIIRRGIEYNAIGQRVAYHMYRSHPEDCDRLLINDLIRVPASEVLHIYQPLRPGQQRGISWLGPIMAKLKDVGDFDDAELLRKKTRAMLVGAVQRPIRSNQVDLDDLQKLWGGTAEIDGQDAGAAALEPGTMQYLEPGEEVIFNDPAEVGNSYLPFMQTQGRAIATAVNLLYEMVTGDWHQGNDRLFRAAFNDFRRGIEPIQHNLMVFRYCRPLMQRWGQVARLSGAIGENVETDMVTWVPQGWPYINPVQDATARKIEIRGGWNSRKRIARERGEDIRAIDAENQADQQRAAGLGLVYDTDPGAVSNAGIAQRDDGEAA